MANISKLKRDKMLAFLEELKKTHNDDESIRAFNEIENSLCEKKYGLVFEEHTEEVDERLQNEIPVLCEDKKRRICKDEALPWNFILEGDNLQALYLLEKTHKGRIDCIYIDPPYNTGAKDWKYNNDYVVKEDVYRHSKWLSMMKSRLLIAKRLLNQSTGVLICTIDEKEFSHLGCLLEEIFPEAYIQMVTIVINPKGSTRGRFSRVEEYAYFCFMPNAYVVNGTDSMLGAKDYNNINNKPRWKGLLRSGIGARREDSPNLFYPILIDLNNNRIVCANPPLPSTQSVDKTASINGYFAAWPIRDDGTEGRWMLSYDTFNNMLSKGYIQMGKFDKIRHTYGFSYLSKKYQEQINSGELSIVDWSDNGQSVVVQYSNIQTRQIKTVWNRTRHDAGAYGSDLVSDVIGKSRAFTYPKSLYSEYDALSAIIRNNKKAIVLDFFAGSGTTQHAINLLNSEDGGNRQCIMVTNNEVSVEEEKKLTQQGFKKGDDEWEALGIAKSVTWPRTLCSIIGCDINGNALQGDYGVEEEVYAIDEESAVVSKNTGKPIKHNVYKKIKIQTMPELAKIQKADGFQCNVKYFKCDWIPRRPEDYLLSNALCLHVKEMIELQTGREVDGVKQVLILNKDDYNKTVLNPDIYEKIETVWLNQNMVLSSEELEPLKAKGFKYIPREYFGHELREAAE